VILVCTTLTELNLVGNSIEDSGSESIAAVLGECPALKFLDFQENDIGSVGNRRLDASSTGTLELWLDDSNFYSEEEDEEEEEEEDTSDVDSVQEDEDEAQEDPHID
jgi:hypothetical protein